MPHTSGLPGSVREPDKNALWRNGLPESMPCEFIVPGSAKVPDMFNIAAISCLLTKESPRFLTVEPPYSLILMGPFGEIPRLDRRERTLAIVPLVVNK